MRNQAQAGRRQRLAVIAVLTLVTATLSTAELSADEWPRWNTPEEAGFSSQAVAAAYAHWQSIPDAPIAAFVLVFKGKILASFGSETETFWCHSMRKSFLSALYGIHVANGNIDLDMTLEELGIDDTTPLTAAEKQAKVRHLLKARSGVYIEAACEAPEMKEARPPRGSHPPDTFWYYNNWDFNALGTIFRQETGRDIFWEFQDRIAQRIGMQDFEARHCEYAYEQALSIHPCYTFRMSTRDRARFGQLFLQNGKWGEHQIVPEDWVTESTQPYSRDPNLPSRGYGYMWWTYDPEFFQLFLSDSRLHQLWGIHASGYGGQGILVLPDAEIVVAFGVDVYQGGELDVLEIAPLLEVLFTGREIIDLQLQKAKAKPKKVSAGGRLKLIAKSRNGSDDPSLETAVDFYLSPERALAEDARWLGKAKLKTLIPGKKKVVRLKQDLPDDLPEGTYYLVTVVDEDKTNYDLQRKNNVKIGPTVIVR